MPTSSDGVTLPTASAIAPREPARRAGSRNQTSPAAGRAGRRRWRRLPLACAFLVGLPAISAADAQQHVLPFDDFRRGQEQFCRALVDDLNQPIDWHLALDVSASYKESRDGLASTVSNVLLGLPLQERDMLRLDTFGTSYSRGEQSRLLSDLWLRSLESGPNRAQGLVLPLLPYLGRHPRQPHTDLERLPSFIAAEPHEDCRGTRYFVVLTDGRNDPGTRPAQPSLFHLDSPRGTPCLAAAAANLAFAQRTGLLFVIDPGMLPKTEQEIVEREWGQLWPKDLPTHLPAIADVPDPETVVWIAPSDRPLLSEWNRRRIGRLDGIFPCLLSSPLSKTSQLSALGRPYRRQPPPTLGGCLTAGSSCQIGMPPESFFGFRRGRDLPLVLVARGQDSAAHTLVVTVTSPTLEIKKRLAIESHGQTHSWETLLIDLEFPFEKDTLALHPLPWNVSLALAGSYSSLPFLQFQLTSPPGGPDFPAEEITSLARQRGRWLAIAALVLAIVAAILVRAMSPEQQTLMWLQARPKPFTAKTGRVKRPQHFRFELADQPRRWSRVFRGDGPQLDRGKIQLDVLQLFGSLYCAVYYADPRRRQVTRIPGTEFEQFAIPGPNPDLFGLFLPPQGYWKPPKAAADVAAWLAKQPHRRRPLKSRLVDACRRPFVSRSLKWRRTIPIPDLGSDAAELPTKSLSIVAHLSTAARVVSWLPGLFMLLALTCAGLALWRAFSLEVFPLRWREVLLLFAAAAALRLLWHWWSWSPRGSDKWKRHIKFTGWFSRWSVIAAGIVLPFVPFPPMRLAMLLVPILIGLGLALALMTDAIVFHRLKAQTTVSVVEIAIEWLLKISPAML